MKRSDDIATEIRALTEAVQALDPSDLAAGLSELNDTLRDVRDGGTDQGPDLPGLSRSAGT